LPRFSRKTPKIAGRAVFYPTNSKNTPDHRGFAAFSTKKPQNLPAPQTAIGTNIGEIRGKVHSFRLYNHVLCIGGWQ
jgi:hypothetical protein